MHTSSGWTLAVLAACGADQTTTYVARDPCAPLALTTPAATPDELDGIAAARALWRDRGVAAFDAVVDPAPAAPGASLEIQFADAAPAFHGQYDPATGRVLINRDVTDAATLAIVIAHELGHAFGLVHIAPTERTSVMNPGNLSTAPTDDDQRALEALWSPCR